MVYKLLFSERFDRQFSKLDKSVQKLLIAWFQKNIEQTDNPRQHGKALSHNRSEQWRYRIGDYRVICDIQDKELVILALEVGHRKNVYK